MRRRYRPSRIGFRLFVFNLLVVFVPVVGILYLDVYEEQLLQAQERSLVQQARLAAAALASGSGPIAERSASFLAAMGEHGEARIKVFDAGGAPIADSARMLAKAAPQTPDTYSQIRDPREKFVYRVGATIVHLRDRAGMMVSRWFSRPPSSGGPPEIGVVTPAEVQSALSGRYGASMRPTPGQRSLTMHSAMPVRQSGAVTGAVVVSQSTYRILQALYRVRVRVFQIVLLSMAAAAVFTWIASSTIVNPIVRLRHMAVALASRRGDLAGVFGRVERRDEIGDLARSLESLASRLDAQIKLLESFAADVSHEFRNPLAAIRTAAETIADVDAPAERERFRTLLLRDVDRLEGLVGGVRELARIDTELSSEAGTMTVDVAGLWRGIIDGRRRTSGSEISLEVPERPVYVRASPERLTQVFENLADNAISLAPTGTKLEVSVTPGRETCRVNISDRGPGIPDAHLDRVFDRFFSYRPEGDRREHMGLGLAIAKAIVNGYGGRISARNRTGGGAEFVVELPVAE